MKTYRLCVATYKRKTPRCLDILKNDKTAVLYLYVRESEYVNGFYNHLKDNERIKFKLLSSNATDLGLTRQEIVESCVQDGIDYCVMLDDTVANIFDSNDETRTIDDVIMSAIDNAENDPFSNLIVDITLSKKIAIDQNNREVVLNQSFLSKEKYFKVVPWQAHIINVKLMTSSNIRYESTKDGGFEDLLFFGRCVKKGLITVGYDNLSFSAEYGNVLKSGGSHETEFTMTDLQKKYYRCSKICVDKLQLDGLSLETRYRSYVGAVVTNCHWDLDFYREVLVYHRKENSDLIKLGLNSEKIYFKF